MILFPRKRRRLLFAGKLTKTIWTNTFSRRGRPNLSNAEILKDSLKKIIRMKKKSADYKKACKISLHTPRDTCFLLMYD